MAFQQIKEEKEVSVMEEVFGSDPIVENKNKEETMSGEYDKMLAADAKKEEGAKKRKYVTLDAQDNDLASRCIKTIQNVAHLGGFYIQGPVVLIDQKTKIRWQ